MPAKPEAAAAANEAPAAPAAKGGKGGMLPLILAVLLAPAITWAIAQFVLIPQLKHELAGGAAAPAAEAGAAESGHEGGKEAAKGEGGKGGSASTQNGYTFENVVVNLAGSMGTRYLKTTFLVTGADAGLKSEFDSHHAEVLDVTLNVLSSLTLADLEEAGARNIIREKLIQAYNRVFGRKVAEQVFFSDFVVQ